MKSKEKNCKLATSQINDMQKMLIDWEYESTPGAEERLETIFEFLVQDEEQKKMKKIIQKEKK